MPSFSFISKSYFDGEMSFELYVHLFVLINIKNIIRGKDQ
jgi:hypothetical protein